jgi:hypothetical protein
MMQVREGSRLLTRVSVSDHILIDALDLQGVLLDGLNRSDVRAERSDQIRLPNDPLHLPAKIAGASRPEKKPIDPILNKLLHTANVGGDNGCFSEKRLVDG